MPNYTTGESRKPLQNKGFTGAMWNDGEASQKIGKLPFYH